MITQDPLSSEQLEILQIYGAKTPRELLVGLCDALGDDPAIRDDQDRTRDHEEIYMGAHDEIISEHGIPVPEGVNPKKWAEAHLPNILLHFATHIETAFWVGKNYDEDFNPGNLSVQDYRELFVVAKYAPQMLPELAARGMLDSGMIAPLKSRYPDAMAEHIEQIVQKWSEQGELNVEEARALASHYPQTITETVLQRLDKSHFYSELPHFAKRTPHAVTEALLLELNRYYTIVEHFPAIYHHAPHAITDRLCEAAGTRLETVQAKAQKSGTKKKEPGDATGGTAGNCTPP